MKPVMLDLFCGAGGASMGYARAGFRMIGVDINPQPRYPFDFIQADAMTVSLNGFAFVHASPPCQLYSVLKHFAADAVDLVDPVRERLVRSGSVYVIENVPGAPLRMPLTLCGTQFGLRVGERWLRRHRLFESNIRVATPSRMDNCQGRLIGGVYGKGGAHAPGVRAGHQLTRDLARTAMGIEWMTRYELAQAIPPAYTEYIGRQLIAALS